MAFTYRGTKYINVEGLFDVKKAYLYSKILFPHYKKSKLIVMFRSEQEQPPDVPQHYFSGNVIEGVVPINRKVNIHRRDTGELVGSTTSSDIDGYFYCVTTYSGSHYVVCLDDIVGVDYNDLIYGNILPATVSG